MNIAAAPRVLDRLGVLGDPTRARLLALLDGEEYAVSELCVALQTPQSTVSRHLRILADDGWVAARSEGTSRYYRMAPGLGAEALALWRIVGDALRDEPWAREDRERAASVLERRRDRSVAFFARSAGRWDQLREEMYGPGAELLPLYGLLDPGWTVADLGTGTGALAARLAPWVSRVVGVDRSPEMLEAARRRLHGVEGVELRLGELTDLPLDDGEADLAVLSLVLHFVPDPPRALREARRALAPGGRLVVVDIRPHERREHLEEMGHLWPGFDPAKLDAWLGEAGFSRRHVSRVPPDPEARGPLLFLATATAPGAAAD